MQGIETFRVARNFWFVGEEKIDDIFLTVLTSQVERC